MTDSSVRDDEQPATDAVRSQSWDRALQAFGTAFIFEERARTLKHRLRLLTFVGQLVPVAAGSILLAYGTGFRAMAVIVAVLAAIGIGQVVVFTWSLVASWVEGYEYAIRSVVANQRLYREFRTVAQDRATHYDALKNSFEILSATDDARREEDHNQAITEREKRMAMRAGLRQFGRTCVACEQVPTDMIPTDCGVCGDFGSRYGKWKRGG